MRLNALLQNSDAIITLEVCIAAGVTDTSAAYLFCFRQQLIITSPLLGNGVLWWACLCSSVCLSVHRHMSGTTHTKLTNGHGSVLLWWHYNMLLADTRVPGARVSASPMIQAFQPTTMASIGLLVLAQAYTVCCGDCVPANLQQQHRALQREGRIAASHPLPPPLRPRLRVNKHTWLSALVDRSGSPCRGMQCL